MARLILSHSQEKVQTIPYFIKSIGKSVTTVEGLMSVFLYNYQETSKEALEMSYLSWIINDLKLDVIGARLLAIDPHSGLYDRYMAILDSIHFFNEIELAVYSTEIYQWLEYTPGMKEKVIGDGYMKKGEYPIAIEFYKNALEHEPHSGALCNRGICHMHLYQYQLAEYCFDAALQLEPHNKLIIQNLFYINILAAKFSEAEKLIIGKAQYFDRDELSSLFGFKYEQQGESDKAVIAYLQAYEFSRDLSWLEKVCEMYIKNGQFKDAKDLLKSMENDHSIAFIKLRAQLYISENQNGLAINLLEDMLEESFDLEGALILIRAYRQNKQTINAIKLINRTLELYGTKDELNVEMALIAKSAGKINDYYHIFDDIINTWKGQCRAVR